MAMVRNTPSSTSTQGSLWVRDRKSTRLNSSHGYISYAVFCLKKKKTTDNKNDSSTPEILSVARTNVNVFANLRRGDEARGPSGAYRGPFPSVTQRSCRTRNEP